MVVGIICPQIVGQIDVGEVLVGRGVACADIVVNPVADASMAIEPEVEVLVAVLEIQTVVEIGSGALTGHILVTGVQLSVLVAVHQGALDGFAIPVINLLIGVESIGRIADHLTLDGIAGTA